MRRRSQAKRRLRFEDVECRLMLSGVPSLAINLPNAIPSSALSSVGQYHQASQSTNWSGYAVQTNLNNPSSNAVTSVSGSWVVPKVSGSGDAYSSAWVGIDGYTSSSVEQIGTDSDLSGGTPNYYAWYEMYPNASVTITSMPVNVGDQISAQVQYVTTSQYPQGAFALSIADTTTNGSFSITLPQTGSQGRHGGGQAQRSSAEWILEAPASGSQILPLANFGSVTFTAASATLNGHTGPIDDPAWQATSINMVSGSTTEATTSPLTDNGSTSSFTVSYGKVTYVTAPSVSVVTPSSPQSGNVTIAYSLSDAASDKCSVAAEYSTDGGTSWNTSTAASGGNPLTGLTSSPNGTPHTFIWASDSDLAGVNPSVEFRITPTDTSTGMVGAAETTGSFAVNTPEATTTTITDSINPTLLGKTVTFSATVSAAYGTATPTGSVEFVDGKHVMGTEPLDAGGTATFSTSHLTLGSHTIEAIYEGDTDFQVSSGTLTEKVNRPVATTTKLVASPNPGVVGGEVTFTVTVKGSKSHIPTGTVTFLDGTSSLGSASLDATGTATFSTTLTLGSHAIKASYLGDDVFGTSTSAKLTERIKQAVTVSLVSSSNPSTASQAVTFTATVSGGSVGTPTGSVTFRDNGKVLKTQTLSKSGTATFTTSKLVAGSDTITASYSGNKTYVAVAAASVTETVNAKPSSTAPAAGTASSVTAPSRAAASANGPAVDAALRALLLDDSAVPA